MLAKYRVVFLVAQPVHLHQPTRAASALARPRKYSRVFGYIETATEHVQHVRVHQHTRATRARESANIWLA